MNRRGFVFCAKPAQRRGYGIRTLPRCCTWAELGTVTSTRWSLWRVKRWRTSLNTRAGLRLERVDLTPGSLFFRSDDTETNEKVRFVFSTKSQTLWCNEPLSKIQRMIELPLEIMWFLRPGTLRKRKVANAYL